MKCFCLVSILFLFVSCNSVPISVSPDTHIREVELFPKNFSWQELAPGISFLQYEEKSIPLRWNMIKVNLNTPGLSLTSYPSKTEMDRQGVFPSISTKKFLKNTESVFAVNATPFDYPYGFLFAKRRIVGLYIYQGEQLSPPVEKYAALLFSKHKTETLSARILHSQKNIPENIEYAYGGFYSILYEKNIQKFKNTSLDSRMAAGVSKDGDILFLIFVEGESPYTSKGATFEETALILLNAGAYDAMQLDGGSSASMVVAGKEKLDSCLTLKPANIFGFKASFPTNLD